MHIDRGEPLSADTGRSGSGKPGGKARSSRPRSSSSAHRGASSQPAHPADGIVRVSRATSGRKGKGVTLVTGLRLPPGALEALCKELKQRCATGGTVKDGVLELQGDHRDTVLAELRARGHTVKLAGG
jgi:translation initiation factor 1